MRIRVVEPENAPLPLLLTADPSIVRVRQCLSSGVTFVGEEDGRVVAAAVLELAGASAEIHTIAVVEERRRRGLGRAMLLHLIGYAAGAAARRVEVGTGNSSVAQLAFYQRVGFRIVGVVPGFFDSDQPPIIEDGIPCRDMVRLALELTKANCEPHSSAPSRV